MNRELKDLFLYSQSRGELIWKMPPKNKPFLLGKVAGSIDAHRGRSKHLVVGINRKTFYVHKIIWFLETGKWPSGDIDHINGNGLDNRFENLRDVPRRKNSQNSYRHRNGKLCGTSFCKQTNRFKSSIRVNGKNIFLGRHNTEKQAHQAYLKALGRLQND